MGYFEELGKVLGAELSKNPALAARLRQKSGTKPAVSREINYGAAPAMPTHSTG